MVVVVVVAVVVVGRGGHRGGSSSVRFGMRVLVGPRLSLQRDFGRRDGEPPRVGQKAAAVLGHAAVAEGGEVGLPRLEQQRHAVGLPR